MKKGKKKPYKSSSETNGGILDGMNTGYKHSYQALTLEQLEEVIQEFFENKRKFKIITFQGGYDLFCEAMRKEGEKLLNNMTPQEKIMYDVLTKEIKEDLKINLENTE